MVQGISALSPQILEVVVFTSCECRSSLFSYYICKDTASCGLRKQAVPDEKLGFSPLGTSLSPPMTHCVFFLLVCCGGSKQKVCITQGVCIIQVVSTFSPGSPTSSFPQHFIGKEK